MEPSSSRSRNPQTAAALLRDAATALQPGVLVSLIAGDDGWDLDSTAPLHRSIMELLQPPDPRTPWGRALASQQVVHDTIGIAPFRWCTAVPFSMSTHSPPSCMLILRIDVPDAAARALAERLLGRAARRLSGDHPRRTEFSLNSTGPTRCSWWAGTSTLERAPALPVPV